VDRKDWGYVLKSLIVLCGAALTIASTVIAGYRVHRWALQHAPGLASLIPRDGGVLIGLLVGIGTVALWVVSSH
jgi:hypothetical protein